MSQGRRQELRKLCLRRKEIGLKKTILHIFSGDLWAGAEVMVFNLLRELKREARLHLIALSLNEGVLTSKLREVGIEVLVLPEGKFSFSEICVEGFKLFKRQTIDVIHSHRYKENFLAIILGKCLGVKKLVVTLHGLPEPRGGGIGWDKWTVDINYFMMRHIVNTTVAVSQDMKNILVNQHVFNGNNVEVIHNGLEIPEQAASLSARRDEGRSTRFHIGTVGRMVPVKDFTFFLQVAASILAEMEDVRFSILGEGPLKDELMRQAKTLKIDDRVDFLSPRADPFPYYQSLDIYLNTSIHEGIPMSILEAMACGKPVVAPRVGGIPEIISDGIEGFLIERRDPKLFVQACARFLADPVLIQGVGANGRKRVLEFFGSSRMAMKYQRLYCDVL